MLKLRALLVKEWLLLARDVPGLIILFAMPILLIFVVTIAQENGVKGKNARIQLLWSGNDSMIGSEVIRKNLKASGFFEVTDSIGNAPLTPLLVRELVGKGHYPFGVILKPADTTVILLTDPATQESFRRTTIQSLRYIIQSTQARMAVDKMVGDMAGNMKPEIDQMIRETMGRLPEIRETFALKDKSAIQPNIIQNNVPGFILFAMFFIVIPLAGSLIAEKHAGSYQRLMTLPVSVWSIMSAKVTTYLVVCRSQFVLMIGIGHWIFPLVMGSEPLQTGNQYLALLITTIASGLAAIGFGMLTGVIATTQNQAGLFGSVMVVILGVLSGTFFPVHLMPQSVQFISHLSPIRWGIDNYLDLFIRDGNLITILPGTMLLFLFFGLAMMASIAIFAKKNKLASFP